MGVENYIFWSEIGSGFEGTGGTHPPRIPRSTAPGGGSRQRTLLPRACSPGKFLNF